MRGHLVNCNETIVLSNPANLLIVQNKFTCRSINQSTSIVMIITLASLYVIYVRLRYARRRRVIKSYFNECDVRCFKYFFFYTRYVDFHTDIR